MSRRALSQFSEELLNLMFYVIRGMFRKQIDLLGQGKLTVPQFLTLDLLSTYSSMRMKDIAKELNISLPAATGMVDRLHRMGMVKRIFDERDRRVIRIILTPKGSKVLEDVRKNRRKVIEEVFSNLTYIERENYLNILKKIKEILYEGSGK